MAAGSSSTILEHFMKLHSRMPRYASAYCELVVRRNLVIFANWRRIQNRNFRLRASVEDT